MPDSGPTPLGSALMQERKEKMQRVMDLDRQLLKAIDSLGEDHHLIILARGRSES